jgi:hypothetical protein
MQNWNEVGYFADHIAYRKPFLAHFPYFLVLNTDEDNPRSLLRATGPSRDKMIGNPLAARFAADPQYQEVPFVTVNFGTLHEVISLVCRRGLDCDAIDNQLRTRAAGGPGAPAS